MIKTIIISVLGIMFWTVYMIYIKLSFKTQEESWYDICYYQMNKDGHTHNDKCNGYVGGTKYTEYLSEDCIGCPYLGL